MNNTKKRTNTRKRTVVNTKEGGFNSSKVTPRRKATLREAQEHQKEEQHHEEDHHKRGRGVQFFRNNTKDKSSTKGNLRTLGKRLAPRKRSS